MKRPVIIQTKKSKRGESNGIEKTERRIPRTAKFYEEWIPMHKLLRAKLLYQQK